MPNQQVVKLNVVYEDPFHFKNLYKFIYYWLIDNGYLNIEGSQNEKDMEILYSEQVRTGDIKEFHIWWRPFRQPENTYFKYHMHIDFLGLFMKNIEMVHNDKKVKMQKGEITITIRALLETEADGEDKWRRWPLSLVRNFFKEKLYRSKIEQHEDELMEKAYELQRAVKEFLDLEQYTAAEDIFYFEKKGFA